MSLLPSTTMAAERGQALFEFLVFVPFMLIIYFISVNIFGGINGSINQQKITRGYTFLRVKGNSTVPRNDQLGPIMANGATQISMLAVGWRENFFGPGGAAVPEAPCYRIPRPSGGGPEDQCEDEITNPLASTSYLRVKTVFGLCGKSYQVENNRPIPNEFSSTSAACTNQ